MIPFSKVLEFIKFGLSVLKWNPFGLNSARFFRIGTSSSLASRNNLLYFLLKTKCSNNSWIIVKPNEKEYMLKLIVEIKIPLQ